MKHRLLVVGGAEKSGTTSLFTYLAPHPGILPSSEKETDFFRQDVCDPADYARFFARPEAADLVRLEASPGYLAEASAVAPRMARLVPHAHLVFVLRDPVERLVSSFRFYQNRLHLPETMTFDHFVQACLAYERERTVLDGVLAWHLNALDRGRYERHLPSFRDAFPAERISLIRYEDLRDDVVGTVERVARFVGLDTDFFRGQDFERENVSFEVKRRSLQRLAIKLNDGMQGFWRRHPGVKRPLLDLYRRLNGTSKAPPTMSPETRALLQDLYAPTYDFIASDVPRPAGLHPVREMSR